VYAQTTYDMIKRNKQNYQSVRIKHQKISHVLLTENLCSQQTNGESSVLSHGIKLRWKRPTGHCRGPTTNNQKNLIIRAGLRGGQRWQLPRDPRWKGPPRDEIYLFQTKYSFEKFRDSGVMQCCVKYQGPPRAIDFSTSLTVCQI